MMQGDAYSVPVTITAQDGTVITPDMVTCVEITIGNLSRKYPGAVTFDEDTGAWQFPLTQQQTFRLQQGKHETQARVVFASGDVFGGRGDTVFVTESLSKGVLPQPEKETAESVAPNISQVRLGSAAKIRTTVGTAKVILTSSLPPISDATKGQYLTNDGEEAKWADVDALPVMSAATKGKMLTNDGEKAEWGDVPKEVMVVNFTKGDDGNWSADKSWDDAAALIETGGLVFAFNNVKGTMYPCVYYKPLTDNTIGIIQFYIASASSNDVGSVFFIWGSAGNIEYIEDGLDFSQLPFVSFDDSQSLTSYQQTKARENIGLTPVTKTDAMTQSVGLDAETGELYTAPAAGGNTLGITGAQIGQIAKITAVDDSGKPTAWEAVDMAGGGDEWEKIATIDVTSDVAAGVHAWTYDNLPGYKALLFKRVSLKGSTATVSGLACSVNNSAAILPRDVIPYPKEGAEGSGFSVFIVSAGCIISASSGISISPTNYALGDLRAPYNPAPSQVSTITKIELEDNAFYPIAAGSLIIYGLRGAITTQEDA